MAFTKQNNANKKSITTWTFAWMNVDPPLRSCSWTLRNWVKWLQGNGITSISGEVPCKILLRVFYLCPNLIAIALCNQIYKDFSESRDYQVMTSLHPAVKYPKKFF